MKTSTPQILTAMKTSTDQNLQTLNTSKLKRFIAVDDVWKIHN